MIDTKKNTLVATLNMDNLNIQREAFFSSK